MKKYIWKTLTSKFTLFSIVCPLLMVLCIVNLFTLEPSEGDAAFILLPAIGISFLCICIDRLLIRYLKPLWLSFIELVVIALFILNYSYHHKTLIIDLTDFKEDYLILKYSHNGLTGSDIGNHFLFSKKLHPKSSKIILNPDLKKNYLVMVDMPEYWRYGFGENWDSTEFYYSAKRVFSQHEIDSLVNYSK